MTRSLTRWAATLMLAVGAACPTLSYAQTKMSLSDSTVFSQTSFLSDEEEDPPSLASESASDMPMYADMPMIYDQGNACCDLGCQSCCVDRNWFSADYLLWWTKGNNLPALVTTSPAGTAQGDAGVLGAPGTGILFGNQAIDDEIRSGLRLSFGHWADPDGTVGIQATYFSVFDDTNTGDFAAGTAGVIGAGTGTPILARPFFNADPLINAQDSRLISFPNLVDGNIGISSSSEMHSVSVMLRQHWRSGSRGRIDLIGGYRYFRLRDGLIIQEGLNQTLGFTYAIEDRFLAENDFHGGDMGFVAEFWNGGVSLELLAKVALGNLHRRVAVSGTTVTAGNIVTNGGLLAQPTNIGTRNSDDFAALPEFGLNLKFQARENLTFNLGYSLLMLNDVTRTGELIDPVVNGTQLLGGALIGPARPASLINNQTDFWAQGLNFGLTYTR